MRARRLICRAIRQVEVEEFDLPPLADDAVLVQNEYTAVSVGTEIYNWLYGSEPGRSARFPHLTGYCNVGEVVKVGSKVANVQVGDRVAAQGNHASHGVFRSLYYRVPDNVSSADAAFLTMAAIAMHGIRRARIELGKSVAVLGVGIVGQLAMSLARLCGAVPAIAIDLLPRRLKVAKRRGADVTIDPNEVPDVVENVRQLCEDDGANVVIEATGKPAVYPLAVRLACTAGLVVALGSPRGTVEMNFFDDVHLREVDIASAFQPATPERGHIYYPWTKDRDRRLLLKLMSQGRLSAADMITHRFKPEQCQQAYEMLADRPQEALGVVFGWLR